MAADSGRGLSADRIAIEQSVRSLLWAFIAGAGIGVLGGMIGLGGAEFRLPLLIGVFGFAALSAVILNKAMSLIVVITALPARLFAVPWSSVAPYWFVVVNLLAGSLVGAWLGASWATRMRSATLYRVLAVLLVLIAVALAWSHFGATGGVDLPTPWRIVAGVVAGAGIGVVASLMGVAGGELLIPTIVLLYGVDIKIAGTLSLAVLADHARSVRAVQPGRELPCAARQQVVRPGDGQRVDRRNTPRRPVARRRPERGTDPAIDAPTGRVCCEGVASQAGSRRRVAARSEARTRGAAVGRAAAALID